MPFKIKVTPKDEKQFNGAEQKEQQVRELIFELSSDIQKGEVTPKMLREYLEKHNISPNQVSLTGETLMHTMAYCGEKDLLHVLIDMGGDVNVKSTEKRYSRVPLTNARTVAMAERFMRLGADAHAKDDQGQTVGDILRERGHDKVADFVENAKQIKQYTKKSEQREELQKKAQQHSVPKPRRRPNFKR